MTIKKFIVFGMIAGELVSRELYNSDIENNSTGLIEEYEGQIQRINDFFKTASIGEYFKRKRSVIVRVKNN